MALFGSSSETLEIVIRARDEASKALDGVQGKLKSLEPTFKRAAAIGTAGFAAVSAGIVVATKEAGLAEGAWNKFNTVFADGANDMRDWVDDVRRDMPTATHQIARMAADLQDLLVPMGLARDEAAGLTRQSIELANKVAAFNDVPVAQVLDAMKSGFVGMSQPLRQFGIDARVTTLEATALREGLLVDVEAYEKLTQAQKNAADDAGIVAGSFKDLDPAIRMAVQAQALMIQMTNQSADAIDGFAVNQDSYLRRMEEMAALTLETKAAIGEAFLPVLDDLLKKVLPVIQRFADWTKENEKLVRNIGLIALAAFGLIAAFGFLGLGALAIISGIKALGGVFLGVIAIVKGLSAALMFLAANPIVLLLAIIAFAAFMIIKHWDEVKFIWNTTVDFIADKMLAFAAWWKDVWTSVKDFLWDVLAFIVGIFVVNLEAILGIFGTNLAEVTSAVITTFTVVRDFIVAVWTEISTWLAARVAATRDGIAAVTGAISAAWQSMWGGVRDYFVGVWDAIAEHLRSVVEFIERQVERVRSAVSAISNAASSVGSFLGGGVGSILQTGRSVLGRQHGGLIPGPVGMPVPIMAHGGERVIPAHEVRGSGGGASFTINIYNPSVRNDGDVRQLREQVEAALRDVVRGHKLMNI